MPQPKPNSAATYGRYSTGKQDERSLDDQQRICRAYAQKNGLELTHEYADSETSGTHLQRPSIQDLLRDVERRGGPPFRTLLVWDFSRLSRDVGDLWTVAFHRLQANGVTVIDVTQGISTASASAPITIGALSLANFAYVDMVRRATHKALEGRALDGFSTGGRVYGYKTQPEPKPSNRDRPRKLAVIDLEEAAVVVRIFREHSEGAGYRAIAGRLNHDGVPSPYKTTRWQNGRAGWSGLTIRAILRNERYIGRWCWNARKWTRNHATGKRRALRRDPAEVMTKELPHLTIVSPELWQAVRARARPHTTGRTPGTGTVGHVLAGLLRCGVCGGSMTITGSGQKAGVQYYAYGCSAHIYKGAAICPNDYTVSERKLNSAVAGALSRVFADEALLRGVAEGFAAEIAERGAPVAGGTDRIDRQIQKAEQRVRGATRAIAEAPADLPLTPLYAQLSDDQAALAALRHQRAAVADKAAVSVATPSVDVMRAFGQRLLADMEGDPADANRALRAVLRPILLTPDKDSGGALYRIATAAKVAGNVGCGDRI